MCGTVLRVVDVGVVCDDKTGVLAAPKCPEQRWSPHSGWPQRVTEVVGGRTWAQC